MFWKAAYSVEYLYRSDGATLIGRLRTYGDPANTYEWRPCDVPSPEVRMFEANSPAEARAFVKEHLRKHFEETLKVTADMIEELEDV